MKRLALALAVPFALEAQSAAVQSSAFTRGFLLADRPVASIEGHLPLPEAGTSRLLISYTHDITKSNAVKFAPGVEIGKRVEEGNRSFELAAGYQYNNLFQPALYRTHEFYGTMRTPNADLRGTLTLDGGRAAEAFVYHSDTTLYRRLPFTVGVRFGFSEKYFLEDSTRFYGGLHISAPIAAMRGAELAITADTQFKVLGKTQNAAALGVALRPRREE